MGITEKEMMSNDDIAMKSFLTAIFYIDGRYHNGLIWRPGHPPPVSNYRTAVIKARRLMKHLASKPQLYTAYIDAIQEFIDSDYVEEDPEPSSNMSVLLEQSESLLESICLLSNHDIDLILQSHVNSKIGEQVIDEYFMPHHSNIKESSSTYKVRPVYDASDKDENGNSLNDCLLLGPVSV